MDYIYQPQQFANVTLYEWICRAEKCTKKSQGKKGKSRKWIVESIYNHWWIGCRVEFLVKWQHGDSTWETYVDCKTLSALDTYFEHININKWSELPKQYISDTDTDYGDLAAYEAEHKEDMKMQKARSMQQTLNHSCLTTLNQRLI